MHTGPPPYLHIRHQPPSRRARHGRLRPGAWHHHVPVRNVSVVFRYFLQQLLDAYPDALGRGCVVRQRHRPPQRHHPTMAREAAPSLMVIEGGKYSPQDNPAERAWAALNSEPFSS
ncbi:hypothetical protein GCM10027184_52680 [Saccharothrix stipae]